MAELEMAWGQSGRVSRLSGLIRLLFLSWKRERELKGVKKGWHG